VEGTPVELVEKHVGPQVVEIRVDPDAKVRLVEALKGQGWDWDDRGDSIVVYAKNGQGTLDGPGLDDYRSTRRPANLEDVFLRLTGRGLREE
jgi:lipooligosaccharide transport system ATP-binding protein